MRHVPHVIDYEVKDGSVACAPNRSIVASARAVYTAGAPVGASS